MVTWKPKKLYWKPEKNIQKKEIQIGRVTEVLMENLFELFPILLLEISAGKYEFGWGALRDVVCCSSILELCLVFPQGMEIVFFSDCSNKQQFKNQNSNF